MEITKSSTKGQINSEQKVEIYHPKDHRLKQWGLIILGGGILLAVTISSVLIILNTYTALQRHGRAILLNRVTPLLPLLVIGLPLGILIILWEKNHWDDKLILDKNELIHRNGKKHRVWLYKETQNLETDITNINFGGSIVGTKVKLLLEDYDQHQWIIRNHYENMADLIENIRSRILPDLYNKTVQELARGEQIKFHPNLIASKEGIDVIDKHLNWDETITADIKNNKLIITKENEQEPLFKSKVKSIKHQDLLLCLLDNPPIFEN